MALFSRARKLLSLRPEELPEAQHYRVKCAEGHVLRGPRTEGYQALRCPGCGEGIFILPRSPLPAPPAPAGERRPARAEEPPQPETAEEPIRWVEPLSMTDALPDDDGIDFYEDSIASEVESAQAPPPEAPRAVAPPSPPPLGRRPVTGPAVRPAARTEWPRPSPGPPPGISQPDQGATRAPARGSTTRPAARRGRAPADVPAPATATRMEPVAGKILVPTRRSLRARLWRHRHLLLLGGVILLVLSTVGYRWRRSYWERLPGIAEEARARGIEAFATGSFDIAKRELARAADALEALRDQKSAPGVRQSAREAAIFADLATSSLEEIVERVATGSSDRAGSVVTQDGRSFLIDTTIETAPSGEKPAVLTDRILVAGKIGRIDLEDFELLDVDSLQAGQPVTFGARIDSVQLAEDGQWRIRLEPQSGVFITTPEGWRSLERVGFPPRGSRLEDLR